MKKIYISLVIFLLASAFCFSDVPIWHINLIEEFPNNKYISYEGNGKSETEAKQDALAGISAFFSSTIESKTYANSSKSQNNSEYNSKSFINRDITVSSYSELFAVYYTQSFYNKTDKNYYVCAYIDREEAFKIISQRLFSQEQNFLRKKELIKSENDDFRKILFLTDALSEENEIKKLYTYSQIVAPEKTVRFNNLINLVDEAKNELGLLKRKNPVSVFSSGDFSEEIKMIISGVLTEKGFVVSKNSDYKIITESSFPIQVINGIYSCAPSFSVFFENKDGTVSSSYYILGKKSQYNEQTVIKMALASLEDLLNEKLISDLLK